jgi:hypothetical protein
MSPPPSAPDPNRQVDPHVRPFFYDDLAKVLTDSLGRKVRIIGSKNIAYQGKIEIEFYSVGDITEIVQVLRHLEQ